MAYSKLKTRKNGSQFYEIGYKPGRNEPLVTMRWDVPNGWSKRAIERELNKVSAEFERDVREGKRKTLKAEKAERKEAEKAKASISTVEEYGDNCYLPIKTLRNKEGTRSYYTYMLKDHIYPVIGNMKITDVTVAELNALLLAEQKKGVSQSLLIGIYTTLNQLFLSAYRGDIIDKNPMDKIDRPRQKECLKNEAPKAFTIEEMQYILDCVDKEPLFWRCYIRLMIDSGCRRGEITALSWDDIDFEKGTITIRKSYNYTKDKGCYFSTPKTNMLRTIDIDPSVIDLLKQYKIEQSSKDENVLRIYKYVFDYYGNNVPINPSVPTRHFKMMEKKYGIEDFHPHKLRHTFATIALQNNADIPSVSGKLGHANVSTTLRTYTHSNEEGIKNAGNIFREALRKQA